MLTVHLFGTPRITQDAAPLDTVRRKNRALIFYLAAHPQPIAREALLALFWPDLDRAQAQKVLRTTLYDLRKLLGEALITDHETVALAGDAEVDVRQFEAALVKTAADRATLEAALALHRGDFLEGFVLPDAPAFDDWVHGRREAYRALAGQGFARLATLHEAADDYPAALAALANALALEPLQEDLQREALRLHYLNGDRAGAIRRYESLRHLLDETLGVPPSNETRALYDAIITDAPSLTSQRVAASVAPATAPVALFSDSTPPHAEALLPFTGRAADLQAVLSAATEGKVILIEGEAGIGKTRLAEQSIAALKGAPNASALVLRGAAHELEQGLPYQPVIDALRNLIAQPAWSQAVLRLQIAPVWLAEVARLAPELRNHMPHLPAEPASLDESRLWEGIRQFLLALAQMGRSKIMLFVDDLQWADASTLGLLGYLARRAKEILCIATTRPLAAPLFSASQSSSRLAQWVAELTRDNRLARVSLAPLSGADMRALASHLSATHSAPLSDWLLRNAEGNPFFATELVRFARRGNLLREDGALDAAALAQSLLVPPTIQNLIESRVLRLNDDARRMLHLAAVLGREFDFDLLHRVARLSEIAALDALDQLRASALIRPAAGEQFAFDHSLTIEVVLLSMGEARRRALHRHVAETLESLRGQAPDAGLIAFHFFRGNAPERAAPHAFNAGKHATGLAAWDAAIALFESALSAGAGLEDDLRAQIWYHLAEARFHKGDFARSTEDYLAAIKLAQAGSNFDLLEDAHTRLVRSYQPQARYAEAIAHARALRESGPAELAGGAEFVWGTVLALQSAQPAEAEKHLLEALRLLDAPCNHRSHITRTQITFQLANVRGQQGRHAEAAELFRRVIAEVQQDAGALDMLSGVMVYNGLAYHLHVLGDPAAAEVLREGIRRAEEAGLLSHLPYLLSTSGEIALAQGDFDRAEQYFSEGLTIAEGRPIPERVVGLTANLGLVARERGETAQAITRLRVALAGADELGAAYLQARIRIWLAPLCPAPEARALLNEAQRIAGEGGFHSLLEEAATLLTQI